MKLRRFLFLALLGLLIAGIGHAENETDWMPDPNLRRVVSDRLDVETLTIADMQHLPDLISLEGSEVQSLEGLQHAENLEFLHIGRAFISDLTPLAGLENLRVP